MPSLPWCCFWWWFSKKIPRVPFPNTNLSKNSHAKSRIYNMQNLQSITFKSTKPYNMQNLNLSHAKSKIFNMMTMQRLQSITCKILNLKRSYRSCRGSQPLQCIFGKTTGLTPLFRVIWRGHQNTTQTMLRGLLPHFLFFPNQSRGWLPGLFGGFQPLLGAPTPFIYGNPYSPHLQRMKKIAKVNCALFVSSFLCWGGNPSF